MAIEVIPKINELRNQVIEVKYGPLELGSEEPNGNLSGAGSGWGNDKGKGRGK